MKNLFLILFLVTIANAKFIDWDQIVQAFLSGQEFHIVIDYYQCKGQQPCPICTSISLNSTNAVHPTSISMSHDSNSTINIASLEAISTIPEFVSAGYKKNLVTEIQLQPEPTYTRGNPSPTTATVQVYSLDNQYVYSDVYTCIISEGIDIFVS